MIKFKVSLFLFFLSVCLSSSSIIIAQDIPVNYVGWYSYNGYHVLSKENNWAFLAEGTIQRDNIIIQPIQWAYRVGLSYQFKNNDRFASGYAFQYNYPYDEASNPYNSINRRVWEQYTIRKPFFFNRLDRVSHRFMLEQIWTQKKSPPDYSSTSEWAFSNVLRYRFEINLPINQTMTASLYDEIFFNLYDFNSIFLLNQNRIYAGIIFNIDKENIWKINGGYMFQSVWDSKESSSKEDRKRINNVLRISVICNLPLYSASAKK